MLGRGVYERIGYELGRPRCGSTSGRAVGFRRRELGPLQTSRFEPRSRRSPTPSASADAESVVAAAAPQLQHVLAQALEAGGWFGEAHEAEVRKAAASEDPEERLTRCARCSPRRRGWG